MQLLVTLDPKAKRTITPSLIDFAFKYHVSRYEEAGASLDSIKATNPKLAPGQDTGTLLARSLFANTSVAARKDISGQALESLKKITGEDFGWDKEKWEQWWDENKEH